MPDRLSHDGQGKTTELELKDIFKRARRYLVQMKTADKSLRAASSLFAKEDDLWPSYCNRAITYVQKMNEPVQSLCLLLEELSDVPSAISSPYLQLVVILPLLRNQARKIVTLMTIYRSHCRSFLPEATRQRHEISIRLNKLIHSYEDIYQQTAYLLDGAQFSEYLSLKLHEGFVNDVTSYDKPCGSNPGTIKNRSTSTALRLVK